METPSPTYDPKKIEAKWQQIWDETGIYKTRQVPGADNFYCLAMFPYPSGDAHVGHWYNYGPADAVARYHLMQGKNVLHPMGFDSFGLPAENAAIKRGIAPAKWTDQNIASMTKQLKMIGPMYDWDKTVATSKPDYYRWTQWLFLELYKAGLAYRAKGLQNWCPKDQTVLANEQVVGENNVCERCGTPVVKKELEQWFFKITDYADRLLTDLDKVAWPERVKTMQTNWIGKSEGAEIEFEVANHDSNLKVFTTRPDTLFGATYMVLAPEHPLVAKITSADQKQAVEAYVTKTNRATELERLEDAKDKTGAFTGAYAINPANDQEIPIWIADYVLMTYGTGAIMAVPAHDERDWEFAKKFDLPITQVVIPYITNSGKNAARDNVDTLDRKVVDAIIKDRDGNYLLMVEADNVHFVGGGVESEDKDELEAVKREVLEETGYSDITAIKPVSAKIITYAFRIPKNKNQLTNGVFYEVTLDSKDQIPSEVEEGKHELKWVKKEEVSGLLTWEGHSFAWQQYLAKSTYFTGDGLLDNSGQFDGLSSVEAKAAIVKWLDEKKIGHGTTNYRLRDWLISRQRYWGAPIPVVYCDKDGVVPVPEDQLPVVLPLDVEFAPTGQSPLATRPDFYETTCPKCGGPARRETDTMDTFVDSSWYYLRYPNNEYQDGPFDPEAVKQWLPVNQYIGGVEHAILHLLYSRFITKVLHDRGYVNFDEPFKRLFNQGIILGPDGQKMSKSRGNVVNPDEWVAKYGADTFRMYLMFLGPYDQGGPFDTQGVSGVNRFLSRVYRQVTEFVNFDVGDHATESEPNGILDVELMRVMHKAIKAVDNGLQEFRFNTMVASLMEALNSLVDIRARQDFSYRNEWSNALQIFVQLLAPTAPHLAEELWHELGHPTSVFEAGWPKYDPELIKDDAVEIAIQVNGKLRGTMVMPIDANEDELKTAASDVESVKKHLMGQIVKTIVVPRKLVNFVVK